MTIPKGIHEEMKLGLWLITLIYFYVELDLVIDNTIFEMVGYKGEHEYWKFCFPLVLTSVACVNGFRTYTLCKCKCRTQDV